MRLDRASLTVIPRTVRNLVFGGKRYKIGAIAVRPQLIIDVHRHRTVILVHDDVMLLILVVRVLEGGHDSAGGGRLVGRRGRGCCRVARDVRVVMGRGGR